MNDVPAALARFLDLLASSAIPVVPGSGLADGLADLNEYLRFQRQERQFATASEMGRIMRNAQSLIRLIHLVDGSSESLLSAISPRLRALASADVALMRAGLDSTGRSTAWEVMCAAACDRVGSTVRLDEPDVLADHGGYRWGVSCKLFYSERVDTQVDAIVKGGVQAERSEADLALVAVNLTNLVDHQSFLETDVPTEHRVWEHPEQVATILRQNMSRFVARLHRTRLAHRLRFDRHGAPRKKTRAVLFVASTVAWAGGAPCDIDHHMIYKFRNLDGPEVAFATALASQLQG